MTTPTGSSTRSAQTGPHPDTNGDTLLPADMTKSRERPPPIRDDFNPCV